MHVSVKLSGGSAGGEVWSTTVRFAKGEPGLSPHTTNGDVQERPPSDYLAAAEAIATLLGDNDAVKPSLRSMMSSAMNLHAVHCYRHATSGQVEAGAEHAFTPIPGTGNPVRPLQSAYVLTLNAGSLFSRSQRGRIYWPAVGSVPGLTSEAQVGAAARTTFVTDMWQLIQSIRVVLNETVNSQTNLVPYVFSPTLQRVTRLDNISADNLIDRQERRQDRITTVRYTLDVNPTT